MRLTCVALVLLLTTPVRADLTRLRIHSIPPCQTVRLEVPVGDSNPQKDFECLPDPANNAFIIPSDGTAVRLRLEADAHHEPISIEVNTRELSADGIEDFPLGGQTLRFQPDGVWTELQDELQYGMGRWLWVAVAVCAAGGLRLALTYRRRAQSERVLREVSEEQAASLEKSLYEGRVVDNYRIGRQIGEGGMGAVHEAISNSADHARVAFKFIALRQDVETVARAQREMQAMAALRHPHIMQLYGYGETPAFFYIVMELLEGGTLADRILPTGLPAQTVVQLMRPVVDAIQHAHHLGYVHRDLKPTNIMFTADGRARVMDFGLARRLQVSAKITASGAILGTPAYMAPEQISSAPAAAAMDQYALGVIFFEMLTGVLPFDGDPMALLMHHLNDPAPAPSTRVPVSSAVDAVVLRMLAKDAKDRFPDVGMAMRLLEEACA